MKLKTILTILSTIFLLGCSANLLNQKIDYQKPLYQKPNTKKVAVISSFRFFADGQPVNVFYKESLEKSVADAIYSTGMYQKVYFGDERYDIKENHIEKYKIDVFARDLGKYNWLLAWPAVYPMVAYWPFQPYSGIVQVEYNIGFESDSYSTNRVISNDDQHAVTFYGFFRKGDVENKVIPLYYSGLDQLRDFVLKTNLEHKDDLQLPRNSILQQKEVVFNGDIKNIAVLNLSAIAISQHEGNALANRLSVELFNTGRFSILERNQMEEILEEQGFQQSGCTSSECAVEAGRLLNVEQMVTGSISKIGEIYSVEVRLIDVETGKIVAVGVVDIRGGIEDVLTSGMNRVVWNMLGGI